MNRAVQVTKISRQLASSVPHAITAVPLPPSEWFVRGPRGGLYIATNERQRTIGEQDDDWMTNTLTVVDRSAGVRYVRPGSKLAQRADV